MLKNLNLSAVLVALFVAAFLLSVRGGLDGAQYALWADVVCGAGIQKLGPTDFLSAKGLPFFQWSMGPGLLIAPFHVITRTLGFDNADALTCAGAFYASLFWLLIYQSFREFFGDARLAVLGLLTAFLCTPLGYYSRSIASEAFILFPAGVLLLQTVLLLKGKQLNWWVIGSASAILLMIRPYLGGFALPVLLVGLGIEIRNRNWPPAVVSSVCVLMAVIQIGVVHHWMTGNALKSPYSFGDDRFASLDLAHPKYFLNVLLDPFHGLMPIHPLVGIGIMALAWQFWAAAYHRSWRLLSVLGLTLVAVAINLWFQASWYYWWLGEPSFGMRGLILPAIPAVFGVMAWLKETKGGLSTPLVLTAICGLWSFLHLMQGPTSYETWGYLLEGQVKQLQDILIGSHVIILLVVLIFVAFAIKAREPIDWLLVCLASGVLTYLYDRGSGIYLGLATVLALGGYLLCQKFVVETKAAGWIQGVAPASFLAAWCFFVPFAWNTRGQLVDIDRPVVFQELDARAAWESMCRTRRSDFHREAAQLEAFFSRRLGWTLERPEVASPFTYAHVEYRRRTKQRYR